MTEILRVFYKEVRTTTALLRAFKNKLEWLPMKLLKEFKEDFIHKSQLL